MFKFSPGDDVGDLEPWPMTNPDSEYRMVRGAPVTSGRLFCGGAGHNIRAGIWRCTEGAFECTEQGDELMMILSGSGTLTDMGSGQTWQLDPGDTFFSQDGRRVTWDVHQEMTKVFQGHKLGGF